MLAIIPARGGSKGLPRKNILPLCGRPMIEYAIAAAKDAGSINRIVVSTDDEKIAHIARTAGAEVPFMRPSGLAGDDVPNGLACLHMIERLADMEGETQQAFVLIQATSPFLRSKSVDEAVDLFHETEANAVISLAPLGSPIEAAFEIGPDGTARNILATRYQIPVSLQMRQAYGRRYAMSGAVTVLRPARMRDDINYYYTDDGVRAVTLSESEGLDVDSAYDFLLATLLLTSPEAASWIQR